MLPNNDHTYGICRRLLLLFAVSTSLFSHLADASGQSTLIIGKGTDQTNVVPFVPFYRYGYTQTIYPESILPFSGTINKLEIYSQSESLWKDTVQLYMKHSIQENFEDSVDWITPLELDQVFEGEVEFKKEGWTELVLDTPFYYNGTDHLLLAWNNESFSFYDNGSTLFASTFHSNNISTVAYIDRNIPFDKSNPQFPSYITDNFLDLRISGELYFLIPGEERIILDSSPGQELSIPIRTNLTTWEFGTNVSSWLQVRKNQQGDSLIISATAANLTSVNRSDTIWLSGQNVDTSYIAVTQDPSSSFAIYTDIIPEEMSISSKDLGDFDNDGDLDIILGGTGDIYTLEMLENLGDLNFRRAQFNHLGFKRATVRFGDLDNDNMLDLMVSGTYLNDEDWLNDPGHPYSLVFMNGNQGYTLYHPPVEAGIDQLAPGIPGSTDHFTNTQLVDFNNDGSLDLVISGMNEQDDPVTQIYFNDGSGKFTKSEQKLKGLVYSHHIPIDADGDQDWDLCISGSDISGNAFAYYIENTESGFNDTRIFAGGGSSEMDALADVDQDGSFEFFKGSSSGLELMDSNQDYSEITYTQSLPGSMHSEIITGNIIAMDSGYNILVTGPDTSYLAIARPGNQVLEIIDSIWIRKTGQGDIPITGDLDNDGDLDIIAGGIIYKNLSEGHITENPVPVNLQSQSRNGTIHLHWDPGTMPGESKQNTYNLYVGTHRDSCNIMPAMSDLKTGFRRIVREGNTGQNTSWYLKGLEQGTYYWAVQTINSSYQGSAFSQVDSFQVEPMFNNKDMIQAESDQQTGLWADIDSDGDMDILAGQGGQLFLYRSEQQQFQKETTEIQYSHLELSDLNHDNLLDLIVAVGNDSYTTPDTIRTYIQSHDHKFYKHSEHLIRSWKIRDLKVHDLNNDGKEDLAVEFGMQEYDPRPHYSYFQIWSDLFESFDSIPRTSYFINYQLEDYSCHVLDYNLDGRKDLLVTGYDYPGIYATYLFENQGNFQFIPKKLPLEGYLGSSCAWNDFNNDLLPDLLISGKVNGYCKTSLYLNKGMEGLEEVPIPATVPGTFNGVLNATDVNNDGWLDFALGGSNFYNEYFPIKLFLNPGNPSEFDLLEEAFNETWEPKQIDFADMDGDSDCDLFSTGYTEAWSGGHAHPPVSINNSNTPIAPPQAPQNLSIEFGDRSVFFSWEPPDLSPSGSISYQYNIRLGSTPGSYDIICPLSSIATGKILSTERPNAGYSTHFVLDSLSVGTYHWSVQAVGPNHAGGAWAQEGQFVVSQLLAAFNADTVCHGSPSTFEDLSLTTGTSIDSWHWDFGDGSYSNLQHPNHKFNSAGRHLVKLRIETSSYADSVTEEIIVWAKPEAGFSADLVCHGEASNFENLCTPNGSNIIQWLWDFGGGSVSTLQEPDPHGFLNPGKYPVRLSILSDEGCGDTLVKEVIVAEYPVSHIISEERGFSFCTGDSLEILTVYDSTYAYQWLINDVPVTEADSSSYVVKAAGKYSLSVTNTIAMCTSVSAPIEIRAIQGPQAPHINHEGALEFCSGDSCILSVTHHEGRTYQWYRNQYPTNNSESNITVRVSGKYSLEVLDEEGCHVFSSNSVSILASDSPELSPINLDKPTSLCEGQVLTLSINNQPEYKFQWFNTLGPLPEQTSPSLKVSETGQYQLHVWNDQDCETVSEPIPVHIHPLPQIPLISSDNYSALECPKDEPVVLFIKNPQEEIVYQWKKDGYDIPSETSSEISGFLSEASYTVQASNQGCSTNSAPFPIDYGDIPSRPSIITRGPVLWYLACSNDSAYSYRWYLNDVEIIGAQDYIYVAGTELGKYQVGIATNPGGCFSYSDPILLPLGTSIEDKIPGVLRLFPNPSSGNLNLEIQNDYTGMISIEIINMHGKLIKKDQRYKSAYQFSTLLEFEHHEAGIYLFKLGMKDRTVTRKIILE